MKTIRNEMTKMWPMVTFLALLNGCGGGGDSMPAQTITPATTPDSAPATPAASAPPPQTPAAPAAPTPAPTPASTAPTAPTASAPAPAAPAPAPTSGVAFSQIKAIVADRCLLCHSAVSGNKSGFNQSGLAFDTPAQINAAASLMNAAIQARSMPLGNATNMTDAERAMFNQWFMEGANINE